MAEYPPKALSELREPYGHRVEQTSKSAVPRPVQGYAGLLTVKAKPLRGDLRPAQLSGVTNGLDRLFAGRITLLVWYIAADGSAINCIRWAAWAGRSMSAAPENGRIRHERAYKRHRVR
jgi:hypothetical protein